MWCLVSYQHQFKLRPIRSARLAKTPDKHRQDIRNAYRSQFPCYAATLGSDYTIESAAIRSQKGLGAPNTSCKAMTSRKRHELSLSKGFRRWRRFSGNPSGTVCLPVRSWNIVRVKFFRYPLGMGQTRNVCEREFISRVVLKAGLRRTTRMRFRFNLTAREKLNTTYWPSKANEKTRQNNHLNFLFNRVLISDLQVVHAHFRDLLPMHLRQGEDGVDLSRPDDEEIEKVIHSYSLLIYFFVVVLDDRKDKEHFGKTRVRQDFGCHANARPRASE